MRPEDVAAATRSEGQPEDAADQAVRLTMLMEAQAAFLGSTGAAPAAPLEDLDALLEDEDTLEDASDDPLHHGGVDGTEAGASGSTRAAEVDAMHIVDAEHLDRSSLRDEDSGPQIGLTDEDATLLGIDPYEGRSG